MRLFKGNRGNLLHHWTLCECLIRLQQHFRGLHFVTTHSMAPWSVPEFMEEPTDCRNIFLEAGAALEKREPKNTYETAWRHLSVSNGLPYPSSLVFATHLWKGALSLTVCESRPEVADEINSWLALPQHRKRAKQSEILRGSWRGNLGRRELLRQPEDCLFIEMNLNRYDALPELKRHNTTDKHAVYPEDLTRLIHSLRNHSGPVVLQVSSFCNQRNSMPLETQRDSICETLHKGGFNSVAEVIVAPQMASWVLVRDVDFSWPDFGIEFNDWIAQYQ